MLAVGEFYEFGLTELVDELFVLALWNYVFNFHKPQLYGQGLDKGCPRLFSSGLVWNCFSDVMSHQGSVFLVVCDADMFNNLQINKGGRTICAHRNFASAR